MVELNRVNLVAASVGLLLGVMVSLSIYSLNFSYGQDQAGESDIGYVEVFVVHLDNHEVDPAHFLPTETYAQGYYSIYDEDGDFVMDAATCNEDSSCKLALSIGNYEASIVNLNSWTTHSVPFEVEADVTVQASIKVDQGSFKVTVLEGDSDSDLADQSTFGHPGSFTFGKTGGNTNYGSFAMYDENRDFILNSIACNYDEACVYPYDSGSYTISIRKAADNQIMTCDFSIRDNNLTPIEFYLDTGRCNQTTSSPPLSSDGNANNTSSDSNNSLPLSSDGNANNTSSDSNNSLLGFGTDNSSSSLPVPESEPIRLLNYTQYVDVEDGSYHVIGEVQNLGTNPANDITIYGIFYGEYDIVSLKRGHSLQSVLNPGANSTFEIEVTNPSIAASITNYTLTEPSSKRSIAEKQENLGVNITRHYYDNATGLYHVEGFVVNYGSSVANFVKVIVSVYDQQNSMVYVTSKNINSHLANRTPSTFEIVFIPVNASQIASIHPSVESDEYSMVKGGILKSPITITLDSSTYDNGMFVTVNGTVGTANPTERYAFVEILWPDGIQNDRELAEVFPDGSYRDAVQFFSQREYMGETFTVRISYGIYYADEFFVFAKS